MSASNRLGIVSARRLPGEPESNAPGGARALLQRHDAQFLFTGSLRQADDSIRIALRIEDGSDAEPVWSHTEVMRADGAFSFVDGLIELLRIGSYVRWSVGEPPVEPLTALKEAVSAEDDTAAFVAASNEVLWTSFWAHQSRGRLSKLIALCDCALERLPRNEFVLTGAGMIHFHVAHFRTARTASPPVRRRSVTSIVLSPVIRTIRAR